MQALYPAAVVSVQIAEVPDLVSFRFAHVTIFVRKVFFVAEADLPGPQKGLVGDAESRFDVATVYRA